MPRGQISDYHDRIILLLPVQDELIDPLWEPPVSLADYLRQNVRPVVYFLQICSFGTESVQGVLPDFRPGEQNIFRGLVVRLLGTVVSPA